MTPATKGIDAFVLGTLEEVIPIVPSIKDMIYASINKTIILIGRRVTYNF